MKDWNNIKSMSQISKLYQNSTTKSSNYGKLTKRIKPSLKKESFIELKRTNPNQSKERTHIKPVIPLNHERSKSNARLLNDSVVQMNEWIKRSLMNFKTDLLGLKHNERYSADTENLVKLVQKYIDKIAKIEGKFKLK